MLRLPRYEMDEDKCVVYYVHVDLTYRVTRTVWHDKHSANHGQSQVSEVKLTNVNGVVASGANARALHRFPALQMRVLFQFLFRVVSQLCLFVFRNVAPLTRRSVACLLF